MYNTLKKHKFEIKLLLLALLLNGCGYSTGNLTGMAYQSHGWVCFQGEREAIGNVQLVLFGGFLLDIFLSVLLACIVTTSPSWRWVIIAFSFFGTSFVAFMQVFRTDASIRCDFTFASGGAKWIRVNYENQEHAPFPKIGPKLKKVCTDLKATLPNKADYENVYLHDHERIFTSPKFSEWDDFIFYEKETKIYRRHPKKPQFINKDWPGYTFYCLRRS